MIKIRIVMNKFLIYVAIHIMSMNLAAEFPATGRLAASQALSHWELLTAGRLSSLRVKWINTRALIKNSTFFAKHKS